MTASTNVSALTSNASYLSLVLSQFTSFITFMSNNVSQFTSNGNNFVLVNSQNRVFVLAGNSVYARDVDTDIVTKLGFVDADSPQVLTDVPLADGVYELEVRPSGSLWREARGKRITSVTITSGVVEFSGIPFIQNLDFLIKNNYDTRVFWSVGDEFNLQDISFGLWRSAVSPVVVTGPPDFIVPAVTNKGTYFQDLTQVSSEFFAVAAFTTTEQGQESEISSPWDTVAPASPKDQLSTT